eukprot:TRINITY_DN26230_c0_g1_i1.p1 TRINITY_DN26230_c0_g1~~TRINITY_DN26230_c0_g1_i1.p1  ORF type:complete len:205 (+),score=87.72 TRINITY_DN26230_c0_g1_i1:48-617(+)
MPDVDEVRAKGQRRRSIIGSRPNSGNTRPEDFLHKRLDERPCSEIVGSVLEKVLRKKGRELHLKELIASIGGLSENDRDEPVTADNFTEYSCFKHYLHETIYFEDQFDYLMTCIAEGFCIVNDKPRLIDLLNTLVNPPPAHDFRFPETVVDYDRLQQEDEERRIESFTLRKDWVPQIPALGQDTYQEMP